MCLYGPLLNEQPVGCSGTLQRDLCSATRNQTLAVVRKNFYFHAPILWIKQSQLALNVVIKTWIFECVGLILMENPMPTNPPISCHDVRIVTWDLSRARLFSKRKKSVKAAPSSFSRNVCVYYFLQAIQSHQSMCLYGPLYEQPVGWSRTVPRDLLHRHPEPNI